MKLTNSQLNKFGSTAKNETDVTLELLSNEIDNFNDKS